MPKVETLPNYRGVISSISSIPQNYVSKQIGKKHRYKRDVNSSPKRRVVKKLIRVEPIYNTSKLPERNYFHPNDYLKLKFNNRYVDKNEEYLGQPSNIPRNFHRKRVIVKKRRKIVNDSNSVNNTVEYSAQTSNKRRRVIVTRKRVLHPQSSTALYEESGENIISQEDIKPTRRVRVKKIKHTINPISESFDHFKNVSSTENTIPDSSTEEPIDVTTENILLSEDFPSESENDLEKGTDFPTYTDEDEEEFDDDEEEEEPPKNSLQDYEPFFPELTESLDAPILLLKTTVLFNVEFQTKTVVQSKMRTYTFVVTRVNGNEQIVTSTTEVKPHTKTIVQTDSVTKYTTLTLLDLDATESIPFIPMTVNPSMESSKQPAIQEDEARGMDEARYNLATRIMSNGVEVIVAGDKSTLPGEPDIKRVLPSTIYKPVTLKPSTLTNNMMMALPHDASVIETLSSSLYPNQFVTKTCLTTFTYMTTYLENGTTTVSSHEQVVSNIATEERNTGKVLPTPTMGITLTQYPNLAIGTFLTTYTYLNTILDGEQPLVVTSKRIVTNTVTAPDDYLSIFQPDEKQSAVKDTNTYYSTLSLQKTLYEGDISKVISTNEIMTQVVITESVPPKSTSVMTSYMALDDDDKESKEYSTTDVTKTYFVTYTYFNTIVDGLNTVVNTNVSTSSDVVTEKLYLHPKKTKSSSKSVINTTPINKDVKKKNKLESEFSNLNIFATKTYLTTFTYFTTLLEEKNNKTSAVVSSHTKVVENINTETIDHTLFDKQYLTSIRKEIKDGGSSTVKIATLTDGRKIEITAVLKDKIKPTKVLPIEKTKMPETTTTKAPIESSKPNVVTGSTIIFVDDFDDPFAFPTISTPSLSTISKSQSKNALSSLLSSEIVKSSNQHGASKRKNTKRANKTTTTSVAPQEVTKVQQKTPETKVPKPSPVSNLLASINIQALKPVLNAMAGLIKTNLKAKRNETSSTTPRIPADEADVQNRSPIYIPVGGLADIETAESQNVANVWDLEKIPVGKLTHESPLLNGGIPISPGEVITANSDVIVGKNGRVGPRIPAIPLKHPDLATAHPQDIPIGMKPPPVSNKAWPKRHSDHQITSINPIIHSPNKDDYVGPPPPKIPVRSQNLVRGEKYKGNDRRHIPINSFNGNIDHKHSVLPINEQFYYKSPIHDSVPQEEDVIITSGSNFNLQPSIVHEPILLPEVIERSTGQPLLVNIQPSQVAFVNIPHNRTTALIYGGSTEPHINGQYFDDPSPYPEPEFSAIESYSNGLPKFASTYIDRPDQKEVGGVIKVGTHTQPININPPSIPLGIEQLDIKPSRPSTMNFMNGILVKSHVAHHDINVQVPPISFGMVRQGDEFNAHIINHDQTPHFSYSLHNQDKQHHNTEKPPYPFIIPNNVGDASSTVINLNPPPKRHNIYDADKHQHIGDNNNPNLATHKGPNRHQWKIESANQFTPSHTQGGQFKRPLRIPLTPFTDESSNYNHHSISAQNKNANNKIKPPVDFIRQHNRPKISKRPRPRPTTEDNYKELPDFMTPPPVTFQIPNIRNTYSPLDPVVRFPNINHPNPFQKPPNVHQQYGFANVSANYDDEDDGDLISEEGEVIQESNSRPLIPGQVPIEILRANATSTTTTTTSTSPRPTRPSKVPNRYNFIPHENDVLHYMPNIKQPRPFQNPVVRPENHQTNQINHQESNVIVQSGSPNIYANVFEHHRPLPANISTTTTERSIIRHQSTPNPFKIHHKRPIFTPSTTTQRPTVRPQRPVYNNNQTPNTNRPKVTSLPLDTRILTTKKQPNVEINTNSGSQTEEPFKVFESNHTHSIFNFGAQDIPKGVTYHTPPTTTTTQKTTKKQFELNTGEVQESNIVYNVTKPPVDMEVMKPPPISPPSIFDSRNPEVTSKNPTVVHDHLVPPKLSSEEVLGLTPPPRVITTKKPTYSMEIDVPTIKAESSTISAPPRTRRPSRRPTRRPTTTTLATTTKTPFYWQRPVTPITYVELARNKTRHTDVFVSNADVQEYTIRPKTRKPVTTTEVSTTEQKTTPQLVIDASSNNPKQQSTTEEYDDIQTGISDEQETDLDSEENNNKPPIHVSNIVHYEILGSEKHDVIQSTETLRNTPLLPTGTVETVELELPSKILPTKVHYNTVTPGVVTRGNSTHRRRVVTSIFKRPLHKETKVSLPTRYITHTMTSTVTITKTTVVKSLGAPPSTLTILITKTEMHTVIDTVTEFHTLLQPTTIAETVIINQATPLYSANGTYGSYPIKPTHVHASEVEPTIVVEGTDEDLDDFIIHDTDTVSHEQEEHDTHHENDSFFVVMTDKNRGSIIKIPKVSSPPVIEDDSGETQQRDEMLNSNEVNRVLLGGILIASPPSVETGVLSDRCQPECKASRNELCQKADGLMRCVCRPGFARMFPDRPCKPTYTYTLKIGLEKHGKDRLRFEDVLADNSTPEFIKLSGATHEGLDRMVMQSDLRDIYHGVSVQNFEPFNESNDGIVNVFNLQLSDNIDETRLKDVFQKYLRNHNYSLGGTDLYASKDNLNRLQADDFDECSYAQYHDCSEHAHCFNLRGTYTCSCKEGYADLSENILYPGRICSSELVGCEKCHYHGTCYNRGDEQVICECFQWYAGESCQVNLKVLLIALVTLGAILFTLLMICIIITCAKQKPDNQMINGMSFFPQRVPMGRRGGTLDRRAMIQDTSSESGHSDNNTLPYVAKKNKKLKGALKKPKQNFDVEHGSANLAYTDQKDRSLTVMIPRAKYHPAPPTSPRNMTSFDKRKGSAASSNEAKLLSYLDAGPSPNKVDQRKYSKTSESYRDGPSSRKTSGALVSAGFEVSATVGMNNMGTMNTIITTCGTEADRSENATLIQKISADLLSSTGTQSQFNTLRKSDVEEDTIENWLDITPRIQTISESRSFDETTIQPPMKSFRNDYDSKSSQHQPDEANTMAERDLGSTFLLPHTHLYKPDRGSDISGFESL